MDVSGSDDAYAEWKQLVDEADIVLYLVRADKILKGDNETEDRIRKDMRHIGKWLETKKSRPHFFIIGTHADLDPDFNRLKDDKVGDYADRFSKKKIIADSILSAGGWKNAKVIIDSMQSIKWTERLVFNLFKQIVG